MITAATRRGSSLPCTRRRPTARMFNLTEFNMKPTGMIINRRLGISFIQHSRCINQLSQHYRAYWLSTLMSSPIPRHPSSSFEDKSDPPPSVVKITSVAGNASSSSCEINSDQQIINSEEDTNIDSTSNNNNNNAGSNLPKSTDRIAEEEILSLQSELRVHFRHASYDTALETATHLLSLTMNQFGKLHPATASAYNNLGLMNKCLGKYAHAKDAYHESLRIYGKADSRLNLSLYPAIKVISPAKVAISFYY